MNDSKQTDELLSNNNHVQVTLRRDVQEKKKTHPDGGWGWVVVAAAFTTQFVVVGLQNSSGVIFNELVEKYNRPRGETGFVTSISCGMMFLLGPITTSLCQRFGCRIISIIGGFLCSLGMIASAYASSLEIMYLTFGVTWGLGTSFCYFPTLIILVPYFDKRLALVNGIVSSGSGFGTLVLSPFLSWFSHSYGIKSMFFALAALHGLVFLAGFVYRPISDHYKVLQGRKVKLKLEEKEIKNERQFTQETLLSVKGAELYNNTHNFSNQKAIDEEKKTVKKMKNIVLVTLFRDKAFVAWCLGLSVFMLGYFVPFVHLVRYAKLLGIPEVKAAFLISTLSVVATIFKILSGKIAGLKSVDTFKLYQFGLLMMGVATTLVPISHSYVGLVVYAVVFGISESIFIVMIPIITKEIVGVRRLPLALGCVFMLMGIPTVVGAPIAGWIFDAFGKYSYAFYVAGSMNTLGVLIMFFVVLFRDDDITVLEKYIIKEEKEERPASKIIEFACYASSERIYYSQLDLLELDNFFQNNNDIKVSNTSLNHDRYVKSEYQNGLSVPRIEPPQMNLPRPESPTLLSVRLNTKRFRENKNMKLWAQLMYENRRREDLNGLNRYSFCSLDSNYSVIDSVVTSV